MSSPKPKHWCTVIFIFTYYSTILNSRNCTFESCTVEPAMLWCPNFFEYRDCASRYFLNYGSGRLAENVKVVTPRRWLRDVHENCCICKLHKPSSNSHWEKELTFITAIPLWPVNMMDAQCASHEGLGSLHLLVCQGVENECKLFCFLFEYSHTRTNFPW